MIRVYFLPVVPIQGVEHVAGEEFMHDALLDSTEEPDIKKLTQDTTGAEHAGLIAVANSWREPTLHEIDLYHERVIIPPPDPDYIRACEILSNPAIPIPAPDLAELLRIFGRHMGYRF